MYGDADNAAIASQVDLTQGPLDDPDEAAGPEDDEEASDPDLDEAAAPFGTSSEAQAIKLYQLMKDLQEMPDQRFDPKSIRAGARVPKDAVKTFTGRMQKATNFMRRAQTEAVKRYMPVRPARKLPPKTHAVRSRVLSTFQARHPGQYIVDDQGFYYGTVEAKFACEGTANGAVAKIAKGTTFDAFSEYIGQASTRLGGAYTVTAADTNLTQPNQTTYVDEVFHIQAIQARFRGMRAVYSAGDIATMVGLTAGTTGVVNGSSLIFDDDGIFLPTEFWNSETNSCELARALGAAAVVYFVWTDPGIGNNSNSRTVEIDTFDTIPTIAARDVRPTSGAAGTKDMAQGGYLWMLNQNDQVSRYSGGNGLFKAEVKVETDTTFGFLPISVMGSALPLVPQYVGLEWEIRVWGTGFRPSNAARVKRPGI